MLTLTALPLRSLFFAAVFYFAAAANKKLPADTRLRLLAAWTAACGLFICMVTPDMQAFDSRYFAVFGPALSIISIAFLHRFCLMSGISAAKIPLFVGAAVLLNAALAVANLKNTPQLYDSTPDNAAFYESVRQKNLFAVIPQNKWQLFNLSTTAMHAGKIYATSAPCPQNLPPQADMVLVQNSYYQPGKTTLPPPVPLCPELAQKLQHRGTVNIAWTYYDWYLPRPPQFLRH